MKAGAVSDEQMVPWFWNPTHQFALASGISCYRKKVEYAHGGLSLQECLTISLVAHSGSASVQGRSSASGGVSIKDITWKHLRCSVSLDSAPHGVRLDVRTHAGNPTSSEVVGIKAFGDKLRCSVIIEDDDLEGHECWVVILDSDGNPLVQQSTTIGGEDY